MFERNNPDGYYSVLVEHPDAPKPLGMTCAAQFDDSRDACDIAQRIGGVVVGESGNTFADYTGAATSDWRLPDGWTWHAVRVHRATYEVAQHHFPLACASGVVAWGMPLPRKTVAPRPSVELTEQGEQYVMPGCERRPTAKVRQLGLWD